MTSGRLALSGDLLVFLVRDCDLPSIALPEVVAPEHRCAATLAHSALHLAADRSGWDARSGWGR